MLIGPADKVRILLGLAAMGERMLTHLAALNEAGFVRPAHYLDEMRRSCPAGHDDADLLVELVETSKEMIGNESPSQLLFGDGAGYQSALLSARRQARDHALGRRLTPDILRDLPNQWRCSPVLHLRERERLMAEDRTLFDKELVGMLQRAALARKEEVRLLGLVDTKIPPSEKLPIVKTLMSHELVDLGYVLEKRRSRRRDAFFCKTIGRQFVTCFHIRGAPLGLSGSSPQGGMLEIDFHLRHANDFTELPWYGENGAAVRQIAIRYWEIVPGFFWSYQFFDNNAELEAAVRAHIFLYKLEHKHIMGTIESAIG